MSDISANIRLPSWKKTKQNNILQYLWMKPTKAVEVWEVLPTNRFPLQVDCARKETRSVSSSALAVAATQAMHYEPGLRKPFRLWCMQGGSPGRVVFLLIFGQFCTAAPADSSAVVPWKIGMCANQVAGSLPSGLGVCAHTLTDSKIVSIPDTLIKPLKHLFVTNCPSDLASALHDRHVGVWAEWRQQKHLYCKFINVAILTCAIIVSVYLLSTSICELSIAKCAHSTQASAR